MNKKGQGTGLISYFFFAVLFICIWAFWLGSWLNDYTALMIAQENITGLWAFAISNINLWIGLLFLLGTYMTIRLGGSN